MGKLAGCDRVALILMDYPERRRLKVLGHARLVKSRDDAQAGRWLQESEPEAARGIEISIEGFALLE